MSALVSAGIAAPLVELSLTECELGLDACTHLSSFTSLRLLDILKPQFDVTDHMQQHVVEICSHAAGPLKLQVDAAALGRSAGAQHWEQALGQRLQAAGITDRVQLPLPLAHAVAAQGTNASGDANRWCPVCSILALWCSRCCGKDRRGVKSVTGDMLMIATCLWQHTWAIHDPV
uniref:Uncharacterized protein n=1 Tax=Chlamydomonas leiostraca TaxID=1034604 RepID=A0A7S0WMH8_9CHLO|mmetsp:Transcript_19121/g.48570  ORF Transcript_19121/g.48570 Transcript_19121/m.48570 type:complete len:175 (+) Transcript_19121:1031-1555(+)